MTPDEELEFLIAQQQADDSTHYAESESGWFISLDAPAPDGGRIGDSIGRDPWGLVDDVIDVGLDPAEVAYAGDLIADIPFRGGGALADPRSIPHGTMGGYSNHKCRCGDCRGAYASYRRTKRAHTRASKNAGNESL